MELLNIFVSIEEGDVLLIDEIHRLGPAVEEMLYQPMQSFRLPVKDVSGSFQIFPLPKFSVIGTTTKSSLISKPLISRFGLHIQIPHYSVRELAQIIMNQHPNLSRKNALYIALNIITPRDAVNLANRVINLVKNDLNKEIVPSLEFIGYKYGLSKAERYYLTILHNVGSISLNSLCSALQLDKDEITFVEDKLIRKRYMHITSKGRQLTMLGILKVKQMNQKQKVGKV